MELYISNLFLYVSSEGNQSATDRLRKSISITFTLLGLVFSWDVLNMRKNRIIPDDKSGKCVFLIELFVRIEYYFLI